MQLMKRIFNYIFYVIIFLIMFAIVTKYISKKQNYDKSQIHFGIKSFPLSLLSKDLTNIPGNRIIFIYSELECNECIISILKALSNVAEQSNFKAIQIMVCGESIRIRPNYFKRNYKVNYEFLKIKEDSLYRSIPYLEMPVIIVIDDDNEIIGSWKVDPLNMPYALSEIIKVID